MSDPRQASRDGARGALITAVGATASGPLAFAIVQLTHPQPAWRSAAAFVRSYHPVQTLPFFFGFGLLGGLALFIAALHRLAPDPLRFRTTCALIFTAAFVALVSLNYIVQTTFVPALVATYTPGDDAGITMFSMASPRSLAWALEMWGYGLLGVATWLAAPVLALTPLERSTARVLVANGLLSIASALLTALRPGWVLGREGLIAFALWNVLVIAMGAMAFFALRSRAAQPERATSSSSSTEASSSTLTGLVR